MLCPNCLEDTLNEVSYDESTGDITYWCSHCEETVVSSARPDDEVYAEEHR